MTDTSYMDKVLFRGWNEDDQEWHYGIPRKYPTGVVRIHRYEDHPTFIGDSAILVLEESIGQWTGLEDCEGTKIFEGDFVQYERFSQNDIRDKTIYTCLVKDIRQIPHCIVGSNLVYRKVVGNIVENPEMMETT